MAVLNACNFSFKEKKKKLSEILAHDLFSVARFLEGLLGKMGRACFVYRALFI